MDPPEEITNLLLEWNSGDAEALNRLMPYVEKELRRIAKKYMGRENPGHTLQTTALVNEVYLKLIGQKHVRWQNRAHFFALSSQFMRRILVDHAKTQHREKRGAGATHVELSDVTVITPEKSTELIALDEALARLAELDPFESRIVEMRYFGGLTALETAEVLQVSEATVRRHWTLAKAWLQRELRGADK